MNLINILKNTDLVVDGCGASRPKFSIMIPTYNRCMLLKRAVLSAVNQIGFDEYEVVVVDNCSDSYQFECARLFILSLLPRNIKLFRNKKNLGMFQNWNMCIIIARAEFMTILNDDDLLSPYFCCHLDKTDKYNLVIFKNRIQSIESDCCKFDCDRDADIQILTRGDFMIGNPANGSLGVIFNKNSALDIGGYIEKCWPTSDYDFLYRYYCRFGGAIVNSVQCVYGWGVNESLSIVVIRGFLLNDYNFRSEIIRKFSPNEFIRIISYFINKMQSYAIAISHYEEINKNFNAAIELRRIGIKSIVVKNQKLLSISKKLIYWFWKKYYR